MRAVIMREFGPPSVLVAADAPEPEPGPGQIAVDVALAGVTFVETQVRAGRPPNPAMLPELPAILGNGVGGVVAAVGPGADPALAGRHVIASLGGTGGYAESAVADADRVIEIPEGVTTDDAVALLADGRTAVSVMRLAQPLAGDVVVVLAAAGGVGTLLVQLAAAAGGRVVALAGGERKLAVARDLGAQVAIDYRGAGWDDAVREAVGAADVVLDGVGGDAGAKAFSLLARGGRFCPFGMASGGFATVAPDAAAAAGISVRRGGPPGPGEMAELSRAALAEAAAGRLRAVIGQRVALDDAAAAHAAIEARETVGKTLLVVR